MQSISQKNFARVQPPQIQRSSFDRSSGFKTTFDGNKLFPIFYDEALPGDTFKLNASFFCRLNTPIVPIMDNAYLNTFFFEVPVRQVWSNWKRFNGEQVTPGDSTDYLIPTMTSPAGGYQIGSLADYFGIPTGVDNLEHSALPFRAYALIWNEWFRDQNLQNPLLFSPTSDGPDSPAAYPVKSRGKRHDYFTSSLPWPQKSDTGSVSIPLGTRADILQDSAVGDNLGIRLGSNPADPVWLIAAETNPQALEIGSTVVPEGMYADLTNATAATINQLRQSIAVQRLFEKDARGGTRYIEVIKQHFGVSSPDLRLQRPGYLGGGQSALNVSPVAQTQATSETVTPQGNLAAIGTVSGSGHGFTKSFTEHTIIIGLAQVRADLTYQKGLERSWSRQTRFDFFWPELATIGEQTVLQKEIFAQGTADDDIVFGYQERFAEYRYKPSLITGLFRSSAATSLDYWHLSQDFATPPVLGDQFIQDNPPIDRVIATPDEPQFKMDAYFNLQCARPMPLYGIPGLPRI